MQPLHLGLITQGTVLMLCIVGITIAWPVFYYTIKAAVKNGISEAMHEARQQQQHNMQRAEDSIDAE